MWKNECRSQNKPGRPVTTKQRDQSRVNCKLCSKLLNTAKSMSRTWRFVETRAPASRHTWAAATSNGNPLSPQYSRHSARCTMMAKHVKLVATSAGAHCKRLHKKTRNGWASKWVALDVGRAVNGNGARGPCWERTSALALSPKGDHTSSRTNFCSNFLVVCCCQPTDLWKSGLWFLVTGRRAVCQHMPLGHLQTCIEDCLPTLSD